eukprot:365280-Chlamydomonas_euryale.AAC.7
MHAHALAQFVFVRVAGGYSPKYIGHEPLPKASGWVPKDVVRLAQAFRTTHRCALARWFGARVRAGPVVWSLGQTFNERTQPSQVRASKQESGSESQGAYRAWPGAYRAWPGAYRALLGG